MYLFTLAAAFLLLRTAASGLFLILFTYLSVVSWRRLDDPLFFELACTDFLIMLIGLPILACFAFLCAEPHLFHGRVLIAAYAALTVLVQYIHFNRALPFATFIAALKEKVRPATATK